jgi:gamma-glutamylcysteine synthetase
LREVLASGESPADRLLRSYREDWAGDLSCIYDQESF